MTTDREMVGSLLAEQHPDLADEPLLLVDEGWDNVTWRIGARLAARLPRREAAVALLRHEQDWLPGIAARLPVPVPEPVRTGEPGGGFPWPWSVVRWVPGSTADVEPLAPGQAVPLAETLRALHMPAPPGAPGNPFRDVPLGDRADLWERSLPALSGLGRAALDRLDALWRAGRDAPGAEARTWIHGDPHPRNVAVEGGRLAGLLDWGDLTGADPATDLACAWTVLRSADERAAFWSAYEVSPDTRLRARGWAVLFGAAIAASGEPRHVPVGRAILTELLEDLG